MREVVEIKGGKFYRNGQVEPWRFGDWEQIQLVQKELSYILQMNNDGVEVDVDIFPETCSCCGQDIECGDLEARIDFQCLCKKPLMIHGYASALNDKRALVGMEIRCKDCRRSYEVTKNTEEETVVKLKR